MSVDVCMCAYKDVGVYVHACKQSVGVNVCACTCGQVDMCMYVRAYTCRCQCVHGFPVSKSIDSGECNSCTIAEPKFRYIRISPPQ